MWEHNLAFRIGVSNFTSKSASYNLPMAAASASEDIGCHVGRAQVFWVLLSFNPAQAI